MQYLTLQGMVTNFSKSEAIVYAKCNEVLKLPVTVNGETFYTGSEMKVLGVNFDYKLKWTCHINKIIQKSKRLNSGLKFIRNKLKKSQFLKVLTAQYYSTCFYGASVWLNGQNSYLDLRKINAMHYRSLRIAAKDYKRVQSRATLDSLGRTRPSIWAKYLTSSLIIKCFTRKMPEYLSSALDCQKYVERRKPLRPKFFSKADHRIGRQSIVNRADEYINDLDFDWDNSPSNDFLRVHLKKFYNMTSNN